MFSEVDTRVPGEVERQVQSLYLQMYPAAERTFVPQAFEWAAQCFSGKYADYQAIDARYHDFEHTLQGTLCLMRLLHGRHRAGATPVFSQRLIELSLLAILFHDAGYLKKQGDQEGTGAKFTAIHVGRSAHFAGEFLARKGFSQPEIGLVQNMIRCTGVHAQLTSIPFEDEAHRLAGFALATGDLLGQMAAPDYVPKLPTLYSEFAEAARFEDPRSSRFGVYRDAEDLMRNTPSFWTSYVLPRINNEFCGLYRFLNDPFPDGPNPYLERVESNIRRISSMFGTQGASGDVRPT
jgi:hypothetical protein